MQKIPSEFIEPYLKQFLMSKLESLHCGLIFPAVELAVQDLFYLNQTETVGSFNMLTIS